MSTRCNIEFKATLDWDDGKDPVEHSVLTYRHSDGYPNEEGNGVIPDLRAFKKWLVRSPVGDYENVAANWIYWNKADYAKIFPESHGDQYGYGVCEPYPIGIHGDIEFFYRVDLTKPAWKVEMWGVRDGDSFRAEDWRPTRVYHI